MKKISFVIVLCIVSSGFLGARQTMTIVSYQMDSSDLILYRNFALLSSDEMAPPFVLEDGDVLLTQESGGAILNINSENFDPVRLIVGPDTILSLDRPLANPEKLQVDLVYGSLGFILPTSFDHNSLILTSGPLNFTSEPSVFRLDTSPKGDILVQTLAGQIQVTNQDKTLLYSNPQRLVEYLSSDPQDPLQEEKFRPIEGVPLTTLIHFRSLWLKKCQMEYKKNAPVLLAASLKHQKKTRTHFLSYYDELVAPLARQIEDWAQLYPLSPRPKPSPQTRTKLILLQQAFLAFKHNILAFIPIQTLYDQGFGDGLLRDNQTNGQLMRDLKNHQKETITMLSATSLYLRLAKVYQKN